MLSVILLILKIIGIALLVLLGMLLFIMLIVLLVPIRYRVKVEHGDAFVLEGGVSWLLHFIHARISQSGSNRRIWIRILGILIYDSLRPPKAKKPKAVKHKANGVEKEGISKAKIRVSKDEIASKDEIISKNEITSNDVTTPNDIANPGDVKTAEDVTISKDFVKEEATQEETYSKDYEQRVFGKIIEGFRKIKFRIKSFFESIISKIKGFIQKLSNIKNKASLILNFINDDINKKGFSFTYETLKKVLKHILPKKLRSRLIFGTGDPCSTGQALGAFGILYGLYGDKLQITPDFENKVFKGSHYVKGRIRIGTLLIIIIKLLLDKRFKDLKMNYQLLKEAL